MKRHLEGLKNLPKTLIRFFRLLQTSPDFVWFSLVQFGCVWMLIMYIYLTFLTSPKKHHKTDPKKGPAGPHVCLGIDFTLPPGLSGNWSVGGWFWGWKMRLFWEWMMRRFSSFWGCSQTEK